VLESIALRARSRGDVWDVEVQLSAPARVLDHVPAPVPTNLDLREDQLGIVTVEREHIMEVLDVGADALDQLPLLVSEH